MIQSVKSNVSMNSVNQIKQDSYSTESANQIKQDNQSGE